MSGKFFSRTNIPRKAGIPGDLATKCYFSYLLPSQISYCYVAPRAIKMNQTLCCDLNFPRWRYLFRFFFCLMRNPSFTKLFSVKMTRSYWPGRFLSLSVPRSINNPKLQPLGLMPGPHMLCYLCLLKNSNE